MIDTSTYGIISNSLDNTKSKKITLPFDEDEFSELLSEIGIEDMDTVMSIEDVLSGNAKPTFVLSGFHSDILKEDDFENIFEASDLIERIEDLKDYEYDELRALIETGENLSDSLDRVEDGDVCFYPNMNMTDVAEQLAEEGMFDKDFLLQHIDYEYIARDLSCDGYTETSYGVIAP